MMKKLLIFMLVLGLASVSQAVVSLQIGGSDYYIATKGETVTVDLIADGVCYGFNMMVVEGDKAIATAVTDMDGSATEATVGDKMTSGGGYLDNYNGVLMDYVSGYATDAEKPQGAGTMIARFTYTLDANWDGTFFYLAPLVEGTSYEYAEGEFDSAQFSYGNIGAEGNVQITGVHIIPEPATIALLSLGGLLLRRRK